MARICAAMCRDWGPNSIRAARTAHNPENARAARDESKDLRRSRLHSPLAWKPLNPNATQLSQQLKRGSTKRSQSSIEARMDGSMIPLTVSLMSGSRVCAFFVVGSHLFAVMSQQPHAMALHRLVALASAVLQPCRIEDLNFATIILDATSVRHHGQTFSRRRPHPPGAAGGSLAVWRCDWSPRARSVQSRAGFVRDSGRGVGRATIAELELSAETRKGRTLKDIQRAFEDAGVEVQFREVKSCSSCSSTTLADLFTLPLFADLSSAVRASLRSWSNDEFDDGLAYGRQARLRRRPVDSFFSVPLVQVGDAGGTRRRSLS